MNHVGTTEPGFGIFEGTAPGYGRPPERLGQAAEASQAQSLKRQDEALKSLGARLDNFEKDLRHLSELYEHLKPLIEIITSDVRNGPR